MRQELIVISFFHFAAVRSHAISCGFSSGRVWLNAMVPT
jgi:hypothetical protein